MRRKAQFFAIYILLATLAIPAYVTKASSVANRPEITRVDYKELKDGKHQIEVNWGVIDPPPNSQITKVVVEVELTDAKGVIRRATRQFEENRDDVSFTPVPIPRNPIVGVPITDLFRQPGRLDTGGGVGKNVLKFKVTLTMTATQARQKGTITLIVRREGTVNART